MKLVLDTNVVVSGLMRPDSIPGRILLACRKGSHEWLTTDGLCEELERALAYPAVSKILGWKNSQIEHFVACMKFEATLVDSTAVPAEVPGDTNDAFVLAALIASRADYLITGDKALLALAAKHPILAPADFWSRYGS